MVTTRTIKNKDGKSTIILLGRYKKEAARNMYEDGTNYARDLMNSYVWDNAIVFIQQYSGRVTYAMQTSLNTVERNTGISGDKVCNIHDVASNIYEW